MPGGLSEDYVKVASVTGTGATSIDDNVAVPVGTGDGTMTTYTFTLAWGSKFDNQNPADLTDGQVNTLGGVDKVIESLQKVKTAFASPITVTLSEVKA